jgi:hypothetical protein
MNNTSTQIVATPPVAASPPGAPARRVDRLAPIKKILKPIASLRLTVVLFALSMFLVFCGTLAQMDNGLWAILSGYFRAYIAWIPLQVFVRFGQVFFWFPKTWNVSGSFPFPGGYILGGLLLINLLAAHLVRFKISWKRSGILLTHGGLILLMLGELVTGLFAVEGIMTIETGQASSYAEHADKYELAIIDASDPKADQVVVVPASLLRRTKPGEWLQDERLPFDIEVVRFLPNSAEPRRLRADEDNPATAGVGREAIVEEEKAVSGTDPDGKINAASAYVKLRSRQDGADLGTYLTSFWFNEQTVSAGGKDYRIALRLQRDYLPYTLYLEEFRHDLYPGTNTPKNFSSKVRLLDKENQEDREVTIWMNHPLRYRGATFYQSGWIPGDKGTKLQVVTNPGADIPYVACTLVIVGMTVHFGMYLLNFLQRRAA